MDKNPSMHRNFSSNSISDVIEIQIQTQNEIKSIGVHISDSISSISQNANLNENTKYMFNGIILIPVMSFAFYGIQNGSIIQAISDTDEHSLRKTPERKRWNHAHSLQNMPSPSQPLISKEAALRETARLSDIYKMKIELNQTAFRRVCGRYYSLTEKQCLQRSSSPLPLTVVPSKPSGPSIDVLPVFSIDN